jgi:hypothetical protein
MSDIDFKQSIKQELGFVDAKDYFPTLQKVSLDPKRYNHVKVLFVVSNFFDPEYYGEHDSHFHYETRDLMQLCINETPIANSTYGFIPALPYINVNEEYLNNEVIREHREYCFGLIDKIKPELIIPLGNTALISVTKRSGITSKRGREFTVEIGGNLYPVMPSIHPTVVYLEPVSRPLFIQDLTNAYNKIVLKINKFENTDYKICGTLEEVTEAFEIANKQPILGVDTETTGLDFIKDKMTIFGFSTGTFSYVIPVYHHQSPFTEQEIEKVIIPNIKYLIRNNAVKKCFANIKFDQKILMNIGVAVFNNCEDIQFIHSLLDENRKHALSEMVKQFNPTEIEDYE